MVTPYKHHGRPQSVVGRFGAAFVLVLLAAGCRRGPPLEADAPPDAVLLKKGGLSRQEAASELANFMRKNPKQDRLGISFRRRGQDILVLVDRSRGTIEERTRGLLGGRTRTIWRGSVPFRIRWAIKRGDFSAAGVPPGEPVPEH